MKKIFIILIFCIFFVGCNEIPEPQEQHVHQFINYQCECGEVADVTVTLKDNDDIKEIAVKYGTKINKSYLINDSKLFIGWFLNEELFDLETEVDGPITLVARYISEDIDYQINYVIDEKYLYYSSKEEMVLDFLNDFYLFVNPQESFKTFVYGSNGNPGTWSNYIGGSEGNVNLLIYNNDIDVNNNDYFFNSVEYKDKWYILSSYVKNNICKKNKRFGYPDVEYTYGALDFLRYIINEPDKYIATYGGEDIFYGYPQRTVEYVDTYRYTSDDVMLYIPCSPLFDGWYLDENYIMGPYQKIEKGSILDRTFYAKIKDVNEYTISFDEGVDYEVKDLVVKKGEEVVLPVLEQDGCEFLGWYLDYEKFDETFIYQFDCSINLVARWHKNDEINYTDLIYDGKVITYRNNYVTVQIPDTYLQKDVELRACWISSFIKSFKPTIDKEEMKKELTYVLDFLEEYNMNCMIFHVRTHNNAFYQTTLAPIASEYGTYESFEEWDYLEWLVAECHKRGIEFHAWLNPYRINLKGFSLDDTVEDIAKDYLNYPNNPASNPKNILMTYGDGKTQGAILNPAKEDVQQHIVDVCMEIVKKYNVDGIHFDDYFYQRLSKDRNILEEADQVDYLNYISNNETLFKADSAIDKENWRRFNIDSLIYKIHLELDKYYNETNKLVQFGISPTGVYKSGDGSVESGSNTTPAGHYGKDLYCDTVKWINEGWIDYIMPQCYTSFDNVKYSFHEITTWWNKVVDGKNVNLYIGMSLSKSIDDSYLYGWYNQEDELTNQLLFLNTLENVKGVSFFSFTSMKNIYENSEAISYKAFINLKENLWTEKVETPKIVKEGGNN